MTRGVCEIIGRRYVMKILAGKAANRVTFIEMRDL